MVETWEVAACICKTYKKGLGPGGRQVYNVWLPAGQCRL